MRFTGAPFEITKRPPIAHRNITYSPVNHAVNTALTPEQGRGLRCT